MFSNFFQKFVQAYEAGEMITLQLFKCVSPTPNNSCSIQRRLQGILYPLSPFPLHVFLRKMSLFQTEDISTKQMICVIT